MLIILLLASLLVCTPPLWQETLHAAITPTAQALNSLCLQMSPSTPERFLFSSLICGARLPPSRLKDVFYSAGIIHFFVMSGLHLSIFQAPQKFFRNRHTVLSNLLLLFSLILPFATLFSPPITRAFLFLWVQKISKNYYLNSSQTLLATGLLHLLLFPKHAELLSLQLSWLSHLIIATPLLRNQSVKFFCIPLLLAPLFPGINKVHILNIVFLFYIQPLFIFLIFPLTIVAFFLHCLTPLHSVLVNIIFESFMSLHNTLPQYYWVFKSSWSIFGGWNYLIAIQCLFLFLEPYNIRRTRCPIN